jgi:hypothetical protein
MKNSLTVTIMATLCSIGVADAGGPTDTINGGNQIFNANGGSLIVVDARNKTIGVYVPGAASGGAVAINFNSTPNIFALSTTDDESLNGATLSNQIFLSYALTDCQGPAYILATQSLPFGWFDGTDLFYATRPFQRQILLSQGWMGLCFPLTPGNTEEVLVGLARHVSLDSLGFKTPYAVKLSNGD